jgi:hypothetical protein
MTVIVSVVADKTITTSKELVAGKSGKPVRIKAIKGGKYLLAEDGSGIAPENITVKRVGKDLHVALEGSAPDQPELIIQSFFTYEGELVGLAEDGDYRAYIAVDGDGDSSAAMLLDGASSALALGSNALLGFGSGLAAAGGGVLPWALAGLGLVGGGVAIDRHNSDDKRSDAPINKGIGGVFDDQGDKQGIIEKGGMTDDDRPTFTGGGQKPGDTITLTDKGKVIGETVVDKDGNWTLTPEKGLEDGEHSLQIIITDPEGNQSKPSDEHTIIIDTVAPAMPRIEHVVDDHGSVVGTIANGDITDDTTPTITGKAEAGSSVHIYDNGKLLGSVAAGADGKWSYTPAAPLAQGPHSFTAVSKDTAGNASAPSDAHVVVIDTARPVRPEAGDAQLIDDAGPITGPITNGMATDDDTPTFTGKAEPGAEVVIYDNGHEIGRVPVDEKGKWSFTPSIPLTDGDHSLSYEVVDQAGNASGKSDPIGFTVDTKPPTNPKSGDAQLIDDEGPVTGPITNGMTTDDSTPTFNGKAEPGSEVVIYDNGKEIGRVPTGGSGNWTFTPSIPMTEGDHSLCYEVVDQAGNTSGKSDPIEFNVDTTPPAKPETGDAQLIDDEGPVTGPITNGMTTDDNTPTFNGKTEPGAEVVIYDNDNVIGRVEADEGGNWTFTPSIPMTEGDHSLSYEVVDQAGNTSGKSDPIEFNVDTTPPTKPETGDAQLIDDEGPVTGPITNGMTTDDSTPTFNGKTEPGAEVIIYDNDNVIGRVEADEGGNWTFTPSIPMTEGDHSLSYEVVDQAGNTSGKSDPIEFNVDTTPPTKPETGDAQLIDDEGPVTGPITNGMTTDDSTPTFNGKTEPGAEVVIYDNDNVIGRVEADEGGNWTFTPSIPMTEGDHSLSYEVVDQAGNTSGKSDPIEFNVDTTPPAKPETGDAQLIDDEGPVTGPITNGMTTDDNTPTFNGKTEPGAEVVIYDNDNVIGRVEADEGGNWTFTPSIPMTEGDHSLSYEVVDQAGNASGKSDPIEFNVDTTPPRKPNVGDSQLIDDQGPITGPITNGMASDDSTPTFNGKTEPGAEVVIYDNGDVIGRVEADENGNWTFTPSIPLTEGDHSLNYEVVDQAGNVSEKSDSLDFKVDTTPPDKAIIDSVYDDEGDQTGPLTSGDKTDDAKPTLSGRAEPNSTVIIKDHGEEIGRASVGADGKWTFEPSKPLSSGPRELTVEAMDVAGNIGLPSDTFVLDVASGGTPTMPSVTGVIDDVGASKGNLQKNDVTDDARPTINGTADPGVTVSLYSNGKLLGTAEVKANGEWSFTPPADLADGPHNITAKATNAVGNDSPTTGGYLITVDTAPPAKPDAGAAKLIDDEGNITGPIKSGDETDDNTPTFEGKAEPNGTVVIFDNDNEIGRVPVDANGDWRFTPTTPLIDGPHSLNYQVVDKAGNAGEKSDPITFDVITDGVEVKIVGADDNVGKITGAISNAGMTDDTTPTLHGTATAGGIVKIYEGSVLLGQTIADAEGNWRLELPAALSEGAHALTATVTTVAHGESGRSSEFKFTVDLSTPTKPTISEVSDDVGNVQGAIASGASTDDTTPTLKGTAEPGSTIRIYDNGSLLGSVVAGSNGVWGFTPTTPLNDGPHNFTVTSEDKAGNVSDPSDIYTVVIDTVPPGKPTVGGVLDDQGDVTGNLASGDTTDDTKPELSGTAEPNSTVIIKDKGVEIGRAEVDELGNWVFVPGTPLAEGEHQLTVVNVDTAGNESQASDAYEVIIDLSGPSKPSITSVIDDEGAVKGQLSSGDFTDDLKPEISGKAEANSVVTLWDNGVKIGQALADGNGDWTLTPDNALASGGHALHVTATDAAGNTSESSDVFDLNVSTVPATRPSITSVRDDVGEFLGILMSGGTTDDARPTINGKGVAGETIGILVDGVLVGNALVDASGKWSFTPGTGLVDGPHAITAVAIGEAGVPSEPSDVFEIIVDTVLPDAPVIEAVKDNAGAWQGDLVEGQATDDRTPTFVGKAEPNSTVVIFDNDEEVGVAGVDENGNWTYTAERLTYGEHSFTIYAYDVAGNISDASEPWTMTVAANARSVVPETALEASLSLQDLLLDGGPDILGAAAGDREPDAGQTIDSGMDVIGSEWNQGSGPENGGYHDSGFKPFLPLAAESTQLLEQQLIG